MRASLLLLILLPQAKPDIVRDLAAARARATSDWRPICAIYYGDKAGKDAIDGWFERADVCKAAAPFVCAIISIAANRKEADGFGIGSGPSVVVLDPGGKLVASLSDARDGGRLALALPTYARDFTPVEIKWRRTAAEALQEIRNNRSREIVLAASLHADACKDCEKFLEFLRHRRLVVPLRRLVPVRADVEKSREALAAAGITEFHQYALLQPEKEGEKVWVKPSALPTDARKFQDALVALYKEADARK